MWTVSIAFLYVCMYVCMYGGHSVLHSNSKLHENFGKMETHTRPRMPCIILVLLLSGLCMCNWLIHLVVPVCVYMYMWVYVT